MLTELQIMEAIAILESRGHILEPPYVRAPTKEESEEMRRLLCMNSKASPAEKLEILFNLQQSGFLSKLEE